ncbi:unnamed protein product [Strongylus vulgaris]|uniref:Uncharacterized protein n=1 Tax=Strongylus vulgaris TaxID=40348 RepID=A0A3P7J366_STRVU|nr:unnamed protein product [Strongylus vulgaris]
MSDEVFAVFGFGLDVVRLQLSPMQVNGNEAIRGPTAYPEMRQLLADSVRCPIDGPTAYPGKCQSFFVNMTTNKKSSIDVK